ncbi:alpha/beta fold hydrolase [Amphiplicatus metriothermophilus]|uniref:Lysophospholipase, alpha-beta hydrolase superfamily n=1 Tax=Amphiplicatus metriothermophilus TaxID=1519374 RepID=A0A239PQW6_9PROT|nr:alpha/beta fold hydrolase [Amphiplicatus metriothermophilus]MBB5518726.1 alpha-beta hydrolase superfamily lysophospholipase [Amphiplicatus metriothermophilus]SNT72117.1 Lysophospholipase, alpha-beta hydrolase superfamily [Amphiplicatus metriothermophilus]
MRRFIEASLAALFLSACVSFPPPPPARETPRFEDGRFVSFDGAAFGLSAWRAENPRAVLIAVHGMNDYAKAFEGAGEWWAREAGLVVYAYDQRGFGRSPGFRRWPGAATMRADLRAAIAAARAAHPGLPLYVLGHSMGAAVVMTAMRDGPLDADGVVLAAPGVWGGAQMPVAYRIFLNLAASVAPGKTVTGERAGRRATDNVEILRAMFADPLVIKDTRLDAVLGVVRLMGAAWDASDEIGGRILVLYGRKDEIIPVRKMQHAAARLCGRVETRVYAEGWHLLFRDLQAERVWRDVAAWTAETGAAQRWRPTARGADAASPVSGAGPATSACAGADGGRSVAVAVQRPDRTGM